YNPLSTARRQPGILMHVHPVLRWNLKLQQPQLPRSEPDGQPTESSHLAKATKLALPRCFICVGGHSASFIANAIIEHGEGAIDSVLGGEGEPGIVKLLEAVAGAPGAIARVPGAVTAEGEGPRPGFVERLEEIRPARALLRNRRKYFIGVLDPCASIEF